MLRVSRDKALLAPGQGQRAPPSSVVSILVGYAPIYDAEAPFLISLQVVTFYNRSKNQRN